MATSRALDLTNQIFGKLTVIERAENYIKPSGAAIAQWKCKCECGNEITVRSDTLRGGKKTSCGCDTKIKRQKSNSQTSMQKSLELDSKMIGETYGDLTILERLPNDNTYVVYRCQCTCGNILPVRRADLINGLRTHCGCKHKKVSHYKDIAGQRFGKLVALYPTEVNNRGQMKWMFQCDCGNQKEIEGNAVTRGNTLSCGCLKQSHGELIIEQILQANNIKYKKEVHAFNYSDSEMSKARFDFEVEGKYFIEFDGQQHFESNNRGWNTPELVEKYKKHDAEKNNWCKEHNVPLIRIPYTHIKDICLEDLQLETSRFILT